MGSNKNTASNGGSEQKGPTGDSIGQGGREVLNAHGLEGIIMIILLPSRSRRRRRRREDRQSEQGEIRQNVDASFMGDADATRDDDGLGWSSGEGAGAENAGGRVTG